MGKSVLKGICYTEKFTAMGALSNQYVFEVAVNCSKEEVARAVCSQFDVSVVAVNIVRRDGKTRRSRIKRGVYGVSPKRKLAIVTVKSGEKVEIA